MLRAAWKPQRLGQFSIRREQTDWQLLPLRPLSQLPRRGLDPNALTHQPGAQSRLADGRTQGSSGFEMVESLWAAPRSRGGGECAPAQRGATHFATAICAAVLLIFGGPASAARPARQLQQQCPQQCPGGELGAARLGQVV